MNSNKNTLITGQSKSLLIRFQLIRFKKNSLKLLYTIYS